MVDISATNKISRVCNFDPDHQEIPTLEQLRKIRKDGSGITVVQVRETVDPVSACEYDELCKLFADELNVVSSMTEERSSKVNKKG